MTLCLNGQDCAKARHYVKLMIQTKKAGRWDYIEAETQRLSEVLRVSRFAEDLSAEQLAARENRCTHLLRVLDAFRETQPV